MNNIEKKKKKVNKKVLSFVLVGVLALALVSALTYYALFSQTVNVTQPLSFSDSLTQTVEDCNSGEHCLGQAITITNDGISERVVKIVKLSGSEDIGLAYVGLLELTKKDSTWSPIGDKIKLTYTVVGDTFEFTGVPEGYTLIYYMDAFAELGDRVANPQPAISVEGIGSLPYSEDANSELANYCQSPDNYAHCNGAKLWVVPNGDLNNGVLSWVNMFDGYYYETDLVYYFANTNNEITVPANSFITFYPEFTPSTYLATGNYEFEFQIQ